MAANAKTFAKFRQPFAVTGYCIHLSSSIRSLDNITEVQISDEATLLTFVLLRTESELKFMPLATISKEYMDLKFSEAPAREFNPESVDSDDGVEYSDPERNQGTNLCETTIAPM